MFDAPKIPIFLETPILIYQKFHCLMFFVVISLAYYLFYLYICAVMNYSHGKQKDVVVHEQVNQRFVSI